MAARKRPAKLAAASKAKAKSKMRSRIKSQSGDGSPSNQIERSNINAIAANSVAVSIKATSTSSPAAVSLATPSDAGQLRGSGAPKTGVHATQRTNTSKRKRGQFLVQPSTPTWSNKRRRSTTTTNIDDASCQLPPTCTKAKVEPTTTPYSFSPCCASNTVAHAADTAKDKDDAVGDPHSSIVPQPTDFGATVAATAAAPLSKAEAPPLKAQVESANADPETAACVAAEERKAVAYVNVYSHSSSNPTADTKMHLHDDRPVHVHIQTPPLPNFEWIEVSHTPEVFLTRLQLRSFLLLFGDLAPPARRPLKLKYVQQKVLRNPNLMWTSQEMGRMMQAVVSIVGDELVDLLPQPHICNAGGELGRSDSSSKSTGLGSKSRNAHGGGQHSSIARVGTIRRRKQAIVSRLMQKGFMDDMWEDFVELLGGAERRLSAHAHGEHVAGTSSQENSRSRGRTSREDGGASSSGGGQAARRGRGRGRGRVQKWSVNIRNRTADSAEAELTVEPAVKYELLRRLLVVAASCTRIKQRLSENEDAAKSATNATRTAGKTLKAELNALLKELKARKKKANTSEEMVRELENRVAQAQGRVSSLSLTDWLDMRKLDARSSRPIGADRLGNVYYILPPGGEDGDAAPALVGYASWVLCQKGPGLDHPLGEEWVETEGDGGRTKDFYAVDGPTAIGVLAGWIRRKQDESSDSSSMEGGGSEGGGGRRGGPSACAAATTAAAGCDVLVAKLQQFAQMLRTAAISTGW
ncbi:hypothetical protein TWF696_005784 [Orbilia brochopaga]|uniref:Uncharacterized protein n=1 Tax=Orbilia brochopaga TaxID=3140254 RepID=A0AAV9UU60_9PEZI